MHPGERTSVQAIASLGPVCAARGACAREVRPSEAMARVAVLLLDVRVPNPLLAAPAAGCGGGGRGGAAPRSVVPPPPGVAGGGPGGGGVFSAPPPPPPPTQVCPVAKRR